MSDGPGWWETFKAWVVRLWEQCKRDVGVLLLPTICVGLLVALSHIPLQLYWELVFERLLLYVWFPLLVVLGAWAFWRRGQAAHEATGLACSAPSGAALAFALLALAPAWRMVEWAIDWHWLPAAAAVVVLWLAWTPAVLALIAHTELWRRWFGPEVVQTVRDALEEGRFVEHVRTRLERRRQPGSGREWGSPHALLLLTAFYRVRRAAVLGQLPQGVGREDIVAYLQAVETLRAYLALDWAPQYLRETRRRQRRGRVLRDALTLLLYWRATGGPEAREVLRDVPFGAWREELRGLAAESGESALAAFLDEVYRLSLADGGSASASVDAQLQGLINLYEPLLPSPRACNVAALTFLALSQSLPPRVRADMWVGLRSRSGSDPVIVPGRADTVAEVCSQLEYARLYDEWVARVPPAFRESLEGRLAVSEEILTAQTPRDADARERQEQRHWRRAEDVSSRTSSWPYWPVLEAAPVVMVRRVARCAAAVSALVVLLLTCPSLSLRLFNTVDTVRDRRAFADYADGDARATAESGPWLAVADAKRGLTILNKTSRIPRKGIARGTALDVATGLCKGEFMVLQGDQGLSQVAMAGLLLPRPRARSWLPAPRSAVWPCQTPQKAYRVLANEIDGNGWLVAIKGVGVARYVLGAAEGVPYRERSWQSGPASEASLQAAAMTKAGVWTADDAGQLRFADRKTLDWAADRSATTAGVTELDADYGDRWATARDRLNGVWLFAAGSGGWSGPFLQRSGPGRPLGSSADVTVAQLDGPDLWLGTAYGLYHYFIPSRSMRCVAEGIDVRFLVARLPRGEAGAAPLDPSDPTSPGGLSGEANVLVGGRNGLYACGASSGAAEVDGGAIAALSVSPDGRLCVYRTTVQPKGRPAHDEVRAISAPFADATPVTLAAGEGWKPVGELASLVGIRPLGGSLLALTSQGAFLYDPQTHSYQDRSTYTITRTVKGEQQTTALPARGFSQVDGDGAQAIALANGTPLHLAGGGQWTSLDPQDRTQPVQVALVGGTPFGLEAGGTLVEYGSENGPTHLLTGTAGQVADRIMRDGSAEGDLDTDGTQWQATFLQNGRLVAYDSSSGNWKERALPRGVADGSAVRQFGLVGGEEWFLREDGSVRVDDASQGFGFGQAPFDPGTGKSVAAASTADAVLIGGPQGCVATYDWSTASWTLPFGSRLPGAGGRQDVVELQQTAAGVLARTAEGVYRGRGQTWERLIACRRWAAPAEGNPVWTLGDEGLVCLSQPPSPGVPPVLPEPCFRGRGMRALVERSRAVVHSDAGHLMFITGDQQLGVYTPATHSWESFALPDVEEPFECSPTSGGVAILDPDGVTLVASDGRADSLYTLPERGLPASIHGDGNALQVAYAQDGAAYLERRSAAAYGPEFSLHRGELPAPDTFDPADVVFARPASTTVFLMDSQGHCVLYDPATGDWTLARSAVAGQHAAGWYRAQGTTHIVLRAADGTSIGFSVRGGTVGLDTPSTLPPEDVPPRRYLGLASGLRRFGDGEFLKTPRLRIKRSAGRTSYELADGGKWLSLTPAKGGFVEDRFWDVLLTPSGKLWGLQADRLVHLEPDEPSHGLLPTREALRLSRAAAAVDSLPTGQVRLLYVDGSVGLLSEDQQQVLAPAAATPQPLATLPIADRELEFAWQADGSVAVRWQSGQAPVWDADGDRLAADRVTDISMPTATELLCSTPVGLLVLDASSGAVAAFREELANATFARLSGPDRSLILAPDGRVWQWKDGAVSALGGSPAPTLVSTVTTGPWVWEQQVAWAGSASATATRVRHATDGRSRRAEAVGGGWRFADDLVNHIARTEDDSQVWLATRDGVWACGSSGQRAAGQSGELGGANVAALVCPEGGGRWWRTSGGQWAALPGTAGDPPTVEWSAKGPTVIASYLAGRVALRAVDGGAVFRGGRLFHDAGEQICGQEDTLHALVPGRGVVLRSASAPGSVAGFARLPAEAAAFDRQVLSREGDAIRLTAYAGGGTPAAAWELTTTPSGTAWNSRTPPAMRTEATMGAIVWRSPTGSAGATPWWRTGNSALRPLAGWWHGDRFGWDYAAVGGAVSASTAVVVTAVGPMVVGAQGGKPSAFEPMAGLATVGTINDAKGPTALWVGGAAGRVGCEVWPAEQDGASIKPHALGATASPRPAVCIVRRQGVDGPRLEPEQAAPPTYEETGLTAGPPLRSELGNVTTAALLRNGRFVYDGADAICPSKVTESGAGAEWLTFTGGSGRPVACVNQVHAEAAGRPPHLVLREVLDGGEVPRYPRPMPDGRLFGLAADGGVRASPPGSLSSRTFRFGPAVAPPDLFRTGDYVRVDIGRLAVERTATRNAGDSGIAFEVQPAEYPVFYRGDGGLALSFDIFTSVLVDRARGQLVVGARGGVYTLPLDESVSPQELLRFETAGRHFAYVCGSRGETYFTDITRVRSRPGGSPVAVWQNGAAVAELNADGRWIPGGAWPPVITARGGRRIELIGGDLHLGGRVRRETNDLDRGHWRAPVTPIADLVYDPGSDVLWTCGGPLGVRKLLPARVR